MSASLPSHVWENGISVTPPEEFAARQQRVSRELEAHGAQAMVFFSSDAMFYLTGAPLIPTERPMALIYQIGGEKAFFVPRLELEHTQLYVDFPVRSYPEYPDETHPMQHLADYLKELGLAGKALAADSDGYPGVYGYRGPSLSQVLDRDDLILLPVMIRDLKVHKSAFELELIRESARWSNYGLALLQERTKPGLREYDVSFPSGNDAAQTMLQTLGPRYRPAALTDSGVMVGYRGQIGRHSYFPHAVTTNAMFRKGDLLGAYSSAIVMGYLAELERNFFLGEPDAQQQKYYEMTVELQRTALEAIKPGALCSDVDRAVRQFYRDNGVEACWRHHTGHSLGSGMHENPVLDIGDHHVLEPGMVFSVEPGLYVEGVGGFRLSDTVAIHEDGVELVTYYSRDLEHLIIEC